MAKVQEVMDELEQLMKPINGKDEFKSLSQTWKALQEYLGEYYTPEDEIGVGEKLPEPMTKQIQKQIDNIQKKIEEILPKASDHEIQYRKQSDKVNKQNINDDNRSIERKKAATALFEAAAAQVSSKDSSAPNLPDAVDLLAQLSGYLKKLHALMRPVAGSREELKQLAENVKQAHTSEYINLQDVDQSSSSNSDEVMFIPEHPKVPTPQPGSRDSATISQGQQQYARFSSNTQPVLTESEFRKQETDRFDSRTKNNNKFLIKLGEQLINPINKLKESEIQLQIAKLQRAITYEAILKNADIEMAVSEKYKKPDLEVKKAEYEAIKERLGFYDFKALESKGYSSIDVQAFIHQDQNVRRLGGKPLLDAPEKPINKVQDAEKRGRGLAQQPHQGYVERDTKSRSKSPTGREMLEAKSGEKKPSFLDRIRGKK